MALAPHYQPAPITPSLGEGFFDAVTAASFPTQRVRFRNQRWAERIGLGALTDAEWIAHFARFEPLAENIQAPLALRYHGHQFGAYNAQLGDGRGFLFAQLRDPQDGRLLDLGTKGSGRTPWSRGGDGRLTLKGGVREILATEMLEALGVSTSKTFSLVETGEQLMRGDEPSPTRASVLVRLSHSHVRFGSFERFAHARDAGRLRRLLDFSLEHYFPDLAPGKGEGTPEIFLREVARRSAALCASWMAAGFVHGVLNTDNMNITGESFDYGPYRFLPVFDPKFVAAYFDETGRYAYGRQPEVVRWNLERLADALGALADAQSLRAELHDFEPRYMHLFHRAFLDRLGVAPLHPIADSLLVAHCQCFLEESRLGFDRFFFDWYGGVVSESRAMGGPAAAAYRGEKWAVCLRELAERAPSAPARLAAAYFQQTAPCTLVIDEIERVFRHIAADDDWAPLEAKVEEIRSFGRAHGRGPERTATAPAGG